MEIDTDNILTQYRAAEYLRDEWSLDITKTDLSKLGKFGAGPDFTVKGRSKWFTRDALDEWAQQQIARNDDEDDASRPSA